MNDLCLINRFDKSIITISACNTITINGDVEFIADGENELILEINNSPCLQNGNKSLSDIHKTTGEDRIEKGSIYSCFPNPVSNILTIVADVKMAKNIKIDLLN